MKEIMLKNPAFDAKRQTSTIMHTAIAGLSLLMYLGSSLSSAQVTTSIIPDATLPGGNNSIVFPSGSRVDISGGHTAGTNLFHSFSDFQVGNGGAANFLSQGASNILSRVTGSNPSNIFGTIGVDIDQANTSNANLFFLNPNGVVFGPNASLDLTGSFHVSTADYLRLGADLQDGVFHATDPTSDLITSAPPSAFGFLGDNPGSIAINQSELVVAPNQSLTVVGGAISLTGDGDTPESATLQSPGGTVGLISVASEGEVPLIPESLDLDSFPTLNSIEITEGALVDSSGDAGGKVVIRGGRLLLDRAEIFSATLGTSNGSPVGIDIQVQEEFIAHRESTLTTDHLGPADSGNIEIVAGAVSLTDSTISSQSIFDESTGSSGDILIRSVGTISLTNGSIASVAEGDFSTSTIGNAGDVLLISDQSIHITDGTINASSEGFGQSGEVMVQAGQDITLEKIEITTSSTNDLASRAGGVDLRARRNLSVEKSKIDATSGSLFAPGGSIFLKAPIIQVGDSELITIVANGENGGTIQLFGEEILLQNNVLIANVTFGDAPGGDTIIDAQRSFLIEGSGSSISSETSGAGQAGAISVSSPIITLQNEATISSSLNEDSSGNGSSISLRAKQLNLFDGSDVSYLNSGSGNAGEIDIIALQSIKLSGLSSGPDPLGSAIDSISDGGRPASINVQSPLIHLAGGQITSTSLEIHTDDVMPLANSGDISLTVNQLFMENGARISADSEAERVNNMGGTVSINGTEEVRVIDSSISSVGKGSSASGFIALAAPILTLSGSSFISTLTENEPGRGVNIEVNELHLQSGAGIDSSTNGMGNAGKVIIQAKDLVSISGRGSTEIGQSSITSVSTVGASGSSGEVLLRTRSLQMNDGRISTSALGNGNAGNILVQSHNIMAVDSRIDSEVSGSGPAGSVNGGQISLNADTDVQLNRTIVSSKSTGTAHAGDIAIQAKESLRLEATTVSTSATQASGGNIMLVATTLIQALNSTIESSVQGEGQTQGGNIGIDPEFVVVQNSNILARANLGTGGNINIVGDVVLVDPFSTLDASAGPAGVNGSVNIEAPIQNLSGSIAPLPEGLVEVAALYNAQCAGQKDGQFSSFTLQGRDRLPLVPGELLPTPLSLSNLNLAQSQQTQTPSSPMAQRLQLPSFTATFASAQQVFAYQGGCPS